jgi:hypothetical protein
MAGLHAPLSTLHETASRPPAHDSEPMWNKCVFWKIRPYWD